MEDNFKLEIISPENIIFSDYVKMVTIPSYEGDMSILKNHIPIITFLSSENPFEEIQILKNIYIFFGKPSFNIFNPSNFFIINLSLLDSF